MFIYYVVLFRLIFWLFNIVMLREIILYEFGSLNLNGFNWFEEDWIDVRILLVVLRRVELCLFIKIVGFIWL